MNELSTGIVPVPILVFVWAKFRGDGPGLDPVSPSTFLFFMVDFVLDRLFL